MLVAGSAGVLYVVATPIGNLEDISLRALRLLGEVNLIAAEDTRRTRKLLARYEIHTEVTPYHEANRERATPALMARLAQGQSIAVVTDAGTPGVSDPGCELVRAAREGGVPVVPVPGASALTAGLSVCGFDTRRVRVLGFLPKRKSERRREIGYLADDGSTVVLFEAPSRVLDTLEIMAQLVPDRRVVLLRELTKRFEQTLCGTALEVHSALSAQGQVLGEVTLVIEGAPPSDADVPNDVIRGALIRALRAGVGKPAAIAAVAAVLEVPKSRVYDTALDL